MKLSTRFNASERINGPKTMKMTPRKQRIERITINRILEDSPKIDGTVELLKLFAEAKVELLYFRNCPCNIILIVRSMSDTFGHKYADR